MENRHNRQLLGFGISPGFALGKAHVVGDLLLQDHKYYTINPEDIDFEYARIKQAFREVRTELTKLSKRVERQLDGNSANIFRVHSAFLNDTCLLQEILDELKMQLMNAEHIVKAVLLRHKTEICISDHPLLRERGDDWADLCKRLLRNLAGMEHRLSDLPPNAILVTKRLLPTDVELLRHLLVSAVIVEDCGRASHAAILARQLGVPVISEIKDTAKIIKPGEVLLVDGITGRVIVKPDNSKRLEFEKHIRQYKELRKKAIDLCGAPAKTQDGIRISVQANIGCKEEAILAVKNGADGIGLFRLEQLYFSLNTLPTEDELFNALNDSLSSLNGIPATIRLLDTGADKQLPFLEYPHEDNPMLGRRGVRFLLDYPDLLLSQLKALLRLSQEHSLRILVPMVTLPDDMKQVRQALSEAAAQSGIKNIPKLGSMVETPAAALCVEDLSKVADFISIGTNDLTQYVMAAGREETFMCRYYIDDHPAIFQLIRHVCDVLPDYDISLCGELAGNLEAIPILLQMGIRNLSVLPLRVPAVKEITRGICLSKFSNSWDSASPGKQTRCVDDKTKGDRQ